MMGIQRIEYEEAEMGIRGIEYLTNHEHDWGPWLIKPYYPTHIVRRCQCGEEDKRPVEEMKNG